MRRQLIWALLLALGSARLASAQVSTTGQIAVIVEGQDGSRLPGATVFASSKDGLSKREAVTDSQGEATLSLLVPSAQYVVTSNLTGFNTVKQESILVRSGQTTTLRFTLNVSAMTEEISVTAETPVVDTTSALTGQDITLDLTESLPLGRSYQSYLQLVPGVLPDDPSSPGNPASKSGVNYSDIGGNVGISTDNFYYLDGVNVTDPYSGTFGANLNTEIIQEQKVLTGGIPAEFVGTPGLVSNVVTKSGSNEFHGAANYSGQNDSFVREDKNAPDQQFSTKTAAFAVGGPIMKDKAWFFGSYRYTDRSDDIATLDTNELIRSVKNTQNQWYGKATWAPTKNDTLSFTFFNDPTDITGSRDRTITNARDRATVQGGNNYTGAFSHLFENVILDLRYSKHNGELSRTSTIREASNDVSFRTGDVRSIEDEQLGGFGLDLIDTRDSEGYGGSLQWTIARHTIKGGVEYQKNLQFNNDIYLGPRYTSLARHLSGSTAAEAIEFSSVTFDADNPSDFGGFIRTIDGLPNRASFYAAYDVNGDGEITPAELSQALVFNSTAGNPNGVVNYSRVAQVAVGEQNFKNTGLTFFVQDNFQVGQLNINAGLRAEKFKHFGTDDSVTQEFEWTWAPRISAVYDVKGDGKMKLAAFYGKYFDPIRLNMTQFGGTFGGTVLEEQVFANGEWVNYRTRGGAQQADALFAPTTKTPWTDDLQLSYQVDLGRNMSVEALYSKRRTRDILEDYDLELYAYSVDGVTTAYPGDINHPDSLWLGLDYFGYAQNPGSNFVIATLEGGERNYQGYELSFRKRYSNNWQALASYTYNKADGNTNSDSNADFQGDVLFLDPRAPNQPGDQPGSIQHVFKAAASYQFNFGLEFGGFYRWNSGTLASNTFRASRRNLPIRVASTAQFELAGFNNRWIAPDTVGTFENPSWGQFDLRVQYTRKFGRVGGSLSADMINVFNFQDSVRNQDLVAGLGGVAYGEPLLFNPPGRFLLSARLTF